MVLYKYINCAVDKIVDPGHTASTDCNTNYGIILSVMLFITGCFYNCERLLLSVSRIEIKHK